MSNKGTNGIDYLGEYMAECQNCHHRYNKEIHGNICPECGYKNENNKTRRMSRIVFSVCFICCLCFGILYFYLINNNIKNNIENNNDPILIEEVINKSKVIKEPLSSKVAQLIITTPSNEDYYVYLKNTDNQADDISFYIKGGNTEEFLVPLGNYEMFYCCGKKWYGIDDKFGPNTVYSKANEILQFYRFGFTIYGHTISLIKTTDGNMSSSGINSSSFPD